MEGFATAAESGDDSYGCLQYSDHTGHMASGHALGIILFSRHSCELATFCGTVLSPILRFDDY